MLENLDADRRSLDTQGRIFHWLLRMEILSRNDVADPYTQSIAPPFLKNVRAIPILTPDH